VTLSPEPPGIFRIGLAPAGTGLAGGLPVGGRARRLQGCIGDPVSRKSPVRVPLCKREMSDLRNH
jgi:hypothetical protein